MHMCVCVMTLSITPLGENQILEIELGKMEPAPKCGGYRLTAMRHILLLPLLLFLRRILTFPNVSMSFQGSGCRDEGYFFLNYFISNQNSRPCYNILAILTDRPAFTTRRPRLG